MRLKEFRIQEKNNVLQTDLPNVWVELSSSALQNNLRELRRVIGDKVLVMAMVKANAYGHGMKEVAPVLERLGVDYFGVNNFEEAKQLRETGCRLPILILSQVNDNDLRMINGNNFELVAYSLDYLKKLNQIALEVKKKFLVHLKIDTGMGRLGIFMDEIGELIKLLSSLLGIEVKAVMTHFAASDDPKKKDYFNLQLCNFQEVLFELQKGGIILPIKHIANSGAVLLYPESHFDLVRVGALLYGFWPSEEVCKLKSREVKLQPVLSLKTKIVQIKTIKKGNFVGYGCTFEASSNLKIGIIPVGYFEGYNRLFSNQSEVLVRGKRAKVIGRVSMNLTVVDLTKIPGVEVNDEVVLVGKQGQDEIDVDELAEKCNTINYEIVTKIAESIPRIII